MLNLRLYACKLLYCNLFSSLGKFLIGFLFFFTKTEKWFGNFYLIAFRIGLKSAIS